jgi:myo-inositol-1(or 4)-monophosphatase
MTRDRADARKGLVVDAAGADLGAYRRAAVEAAEAAGRLVRDSFDGAFTVEPKGAAGDVVTSLDKEAEKLITGRLRLAFPSHDIVSEESGASCEQGSRWTWLVDPLDGSNNIVVGLPIVAIGLTLCRDDRPVVGVIHEPLVGRTWSAEQGAGAWRGAGKPLRRRPGNARHPVVVWTQGYGVRSTDQVATAVRLGLAGYARRVLELWAPLCGWAMLARGDVEAIVGYRIGELDLHGGALIASMTGIEIREFDGRPFDLRFNGLGESRSLVAAAPERMPEVLAVVSRALSEGSRAPSGPAVRPGSARPSGGPR